MFCVDVKQFVCLNLRIEAVSISRKLEVCKHSLTVDLIQNDEALLFIGFGILHGKRFCKVFLAKFIAHKLKYSHELYKCVCLCAVLVVWCLMVNATEMNQQLCSVQKKEYTYRCRNSEVDMLISCFCHCSNLMNLQ